MSHIRIPPPPKKLRLHRLVALLASFALFALAASTVAYAHTGIAPSGNLNDQGLPSHLTLGSEPGPNQVLPQNQQSCGSPTSLTAAEATFDSTKLVVSWDRCPTGILYALVWKESSEGDWQEGIMVQQAGSIIWDEANWDEVSVECAVVGNKLSCDITSLQPDTEYTVAVVTYPSGGAGGVEATGRTSPPILVSTIGQPNPEPIPADDGTVDLGGGDNDGLSQELIQEFSTGSNAAGYTVSRIDIEFGTVGAGAESQVPTVSIYTLNEDRNAARYKTPDRLIGELTGPSSLSSNSTALFTSSDGITLDADSTYMVYVENEIEGFGARHVLMTDSDNEDAATLTGWSAGDGSYTWFPRLRGIIPLQNSILTMKFVIRGVANTAVVPAPAQAAPVQPEQPAQPDRQEGGEPDAPTVDVRQPTIYVYHDPNESNAGALSRLREAREALGGVNAVYVETSGTAAVDRLAGVTNSVMPRFFLGDPTGPGWTPAPKTNNGGLRWLKKKLAELGS